jgi:hypothetical protein
MWQPVSFAGQADVILSPSSRTGADEKVAPTSAEDVEAKARPECANPPKPDDLAHWEQRSYQLDVDAAIKLGFPVGSVGGSSRQRVVVMEFSRTADCVGTDGAELRYGVSARLYVRVSDFEASAKLNIPLVAAEAQLNRVETESGLSVHGYVGAINLPPAKPFSVETYVELMQKLSEIQAQIASDTPNIRPTVLHRHVPDDEVTNADHYSAGRWWGLKKLAEGRSCSRAKRDFPAPQPLRVVTEAIEDVYFAHSGEQDCSDEEPSSKAVDSARRTIRDLGVD